MPRDQPRTGALLCCTRPATDGMPEPCDEIYYVAPSRIKRSKYCSDVCAAEVKRRYRRCALANCGDVKVIKPPNVYCSVQCAVTARVAGTNPKAQGSDERARRAD